MNIEVMFYTNGVKIIQEKSGFFPLENMKALIDKSVKRLEDSLPTTKEEGKWRKELLSDLQEVKKKIKEIEDRYE